MTMTIATLVPIYVIGFIITASIARQHWQEEFGVPMDFMDFVGQVFIIFAAGLIWPIAAILYLIWRLSR